MRAAVTTLRFVSLDSAKESACRGLFQVETNSIVRADAVEGDHVGRAFVDDEERLGVNEDESRG